MRELAILTFVTLDGVMQAPSAPEEDFSGGFKQGGWARPYWDDAMELVGQEAMAEPYDLLLGRRTYETFAGHFAKIGDDEPGAARMNRARKYVATNSLEELDWANSTAVRGHIPTEVAALKAQDGPLLQIHGSWQLIQSLLAEDLIDEIRLFTFPVVVGAGKRLFDQCPARDGFALLKSKTTPNGVLMSFYRRRRQD